MAARKTTAPSEELEIKAKDSEVAEPISQEVEDVIDINLSSTRKKKIRIDGDNNRILLINTSDLSIVTRLNETYPKLNELQKEISEKMSGIDDLEEISDGTLPQLEAVGNTLKEADSKMREYVDYIFDANVSETCAPDGNMYDPFGGTFRYEHIINVIGKLYESNFDKEFRALKKKLQKHTQKYIK